MEINFPKTEKKILKFWKENQIFEKSIERREKAPNFVFFEGPPTANGKPGIHHVLSRAFKDIICRYKTMQGFKVLRKAGWDTHGLPVELEIEKKLGLKNKNDIEKYGVAKFNKKCKESVWQYKKEWEELTERIGFWLDLKNPYITYENSYIETVWWILKEIHKKKLLYQDYKVVPYCPRCGTSLSSHEVAQGYERIKESAIYIKFRIKNPEFENTSLLVWTTTPWTLPGNVAVAVNPDFIYAKVKTEQGNLILAKGRMEACGLKEAEILQEFKGKDLLKIHYVSPYPIDLREGITIYKIIPADFVSLEDGTGLVHIAPAFGEDDMQAIKKQNSELRMQNLPQFPILLAVDEEGKFRLEAKKWAGIFVKDADPLIVEDLKNRNLLFKEELYEHDYPFCWRCKSPLIYYAKQSWFINMQEVKDNLNKNNQKINWIPSHLKEGRFGEWLKDVKDWAISRERYWGTPLPVWQCKTCRNLEVLGSLRDLLSQKFSNNNYFFVRHGHSLRQVKKLAMCWPEKIKCPLTEMGEKQALKTAQNLKKERIDLIFSSDLLRTKQTAQIILKETGAKIIPDKRLREYNVGVFNEKEPKLAWDYLYAKESLTDSKLPRGESLTNIRKRMFKFIEEIDAKYQNKNIVVVSHELPLTILEKTLEGWPLGKIIKDRAENKIKKIETGDFREVRFVKFPLNEKMELDFHKPYIDKIKFTCRKCGGLMERIPEVVDCWFDSGSMPFAQYHYPFENKELIDKGRQFPADFISEAIDQTRGWFYTLLAISTLLGFDNPYKNVISLGHVLDEKGEKMSKSKGNIVDPWYVVEKYGIDAARWYFYTVNQPGEPKLFTEKDVDSALKKFILTFWNCYAFFETYGQKKSKLQNPKSQNVLDKWILSKLNQLVLETTNSLNEYDVAGAARSIEKFTIEDLSLWYIRRSRRRFQKSETKKELKEASETLGFVLLSLSKMMAPFVPFLSEEIYQKIQITKSKLQKSVHVENWPKADKKLIDKELTETMDESRKIVALALSERAKAGIKVRQPLKKLKIKKHKSKLNDELTELIKEEINVKEIIFDPELKTEIELDIEITPELKEEGIVREIIRHIQEMRKQAGLKPQDKISVSYSGAEELNKILGKNKEIVLKEGKIKDFQLSEKTRQKFNFEKEIEVDKQKLWLAIKRI